VKKWRDLPTPPKFTGYERLEEHEATLLAAYKSTADEAWLALSPCPFYAEGGGQVADQGTVWIENEVTVDNPDGGLVALPVLDVRAPWQGGVVVRVGIPEGTSPKLAAGITCRPAVTYEWRAGARRHHTATHLLHAALRQVLGTHVAQHGSRVMSDKLSFDFAHSSQLTTQQIEAVEKWVNDVISLDVAVNTQLMGYKQAVEQGATALFTDKYGDQVRVISVPGYSMELCGGTHVQSTSQIQCFKITAQSSLGSNTRRIEGVAGPAALQYFQQRVKLADNLAGMLKTEVDTLENKVSPSTLKCSRTNNFMFQIQSLLDAQKDLKKELKEVRSQMLTGSAAKSESNQSALRGQFKDLAVTLHTLSCGDDMTLLRQYGDKLRQSDPQSVHVLFSNNNVICCSEKSDARSVMQAIAPLIDGKGGGSKQMCSGKFNKELTGALPELYKLLNMRK
jgi:alanyl-tRNA synthetase